MQILSGSKTCCRVIDKLEAESNGESEYQIMEGEFYEFTLPTQFEVTEVSGIVINSAISSKDLNFGRIQPNTFVGTLTIELLDKKANKSIGEKIFLEVISIKMNYREDYRSMMQSISDFSVDLILSSESPVEQNFEKDEGATTDSLYQKYLFLRSMFETGNLFNSLNRILESPVTKDFEIEEQIPLHRLRRINRKSLKELGAIGIGGNSRIAYRENGITIGKVNSVFRQDSIDILENRFVKHVTQEFYEIVYRTVSMLSNPIQKSEAKRFSEDFEEVLTHGFFKELSPLNVIPMNSQILQRKEGYRELLQIWLRFRLNSKLIWEGGEDIFVGGKKNISQLYEYYLFFFLLRIFSVQFVTDKKSIESLFKVSEKGLNLLLKQGKNSKLNFSLTINKREFNVEYSYNRKFVGLGSVEELTYPKAGSISVALRPDFTISFWPKALTQELAEQQELIVHLHFDAKYKLDDSIVNIAIKDGASDDYKNDDILKMHTYKDAIRRTAGAYILYPGSLNRKFLSLSEVLPSIGAFAVSPKNEGSAKDELTKFFKEVLNHLSNKVSKREKLNYKVYEVQHHYKAENPIQLSENIPELLLKNRGFFPDEINVILGFAKNQLHEKWIIDNRIYNIRIGSKVRGSINLKTNVIEAKYIYLHSESSKVSRLLKLNSKGPQIYSKEDLEKSNYPGTPKSNFYLVFTLEDPNNIEQELRGLTVDLSKIPEAGSGRNRSHPIAISLAQLLLAKK